MALPKDVYQALQDMVGPENVSDDIFVTQGYSKQPWPHGILGRRRPDAIILPGQVEDVQAIIKLANRHRFSVIPAGNYNWDVPQKENTVILDTKRMNRIIEIDGDSIYAVVEPGVTHAQLQAEAMKKGLICNSSWAGGQSSVLANTTFFGGGGLGYRAGYGNRTMLAMEWVLPTGEILRTGSEGVKGAGYFWPEGPGPDIRGLIRGFFGVHGGLGMVTKMGIKLLPWPGPFTFPCEGVSPHYRVPLPPDRFRFHMVRYQNFENLIDAMYKIGRAEIGATLQRNPSLMFPQWETTSKEDFWKAWESGYFQREARYIITVLLMGFSSKRQLEYEEKVLQEIIWETGGEDIPENDRLYQTIDGAEWLRCGVAPRVMRFTGTHYFIMIGYDSLDHSYKMANLADELRKYSLPDFVDVDDCDWICAYDFAWHADAECAIAPELTEEDMTKAVEAAIAGIKASIDEKLYCVVQDAATHPILGLVYGNYHQLLKKIKKALDPKNIANPPHPISVE